MKDKIKLTSVYARLCIFTFLFFGILLFALSGLFNSVVQSYDENTYSKNKAIEINLLFNELYKDIFLYFHNGDIKEERIFLKIREIDKIINDSAQVLNYNFLFDSVVLKEKITEKNDEAMLIVEKIINDFSLDLSFGFENDKEDFLLYFNGLIFSFLLFLLVFFVFSFNGFKKHVVYDFSLIKSNIKKIISWDLYLDTPHFNYSELDEINDFLIFLTENQLSSTKDMKLKFHQISHAFSKSSKAMLLLNQNHKIIDVNESFLFLWENSREDLSKALDIDSESYDSLIGEYMNEIHFLSLAETNHKILLDSGVYQLDHTEVTQNDSFCGYVVTLEFISEKIELDVIHKSVRLMGSGVWNTPVRVKRGQSPLSEISQGLERIRQHLLNSDNNTDYLMGTSDLSSFDELDELDGFEELDSTLEEADDSLLELGSELNDLSIVPITLAAPKQDVSDDFSSHIATVALPDYAIWESKFRSLLAKVSNELTENIESSVLLGYENIVQKLQIVHKEMQASSRALNDSTRYLNEVRAIILKTLISEQSNGEIERSSLAKDINHDVDTVILLLHELSEDEEKTIDLFRAEVDVAERRKEKAFSSLNDFDSKLLDSCMMLSEEMIRPIFSQMDQTIRTDYSSNEGVEE
ncbi:hypothetical protein [Marinomonas sp. 2405UD68-3]|uniref:hypothetical protein n=1 Tax=Marinomonas sp. 2405UD68-3 TaxID=3391835 RepID=UPI0039C98534